LKDILLITPPFTQLNTPYPATTYLKGFLNTKNIGSYQVDLGIEVILALFSKVGLKKVFETAVVHKNIKSDNARRIFSLKENYLNTIDDIILFLQGSNPTFARQITSSGFLAQASRFNQLDEEDWAFGDMGFQDKAKHLATLFLEDLSDFIVECVDKDFGFSRYAEKIGRSANSFNELYGKLNCEESFVDKITLNLISEKINKIQPKLVCFSVPFPGNLYSAFRCAKFLKEHFPEIKIALGGGFPNTELRSVSDIRVFEFFDYITLDDGEKPVELVYQNIINPKSIEFKRTFVLENNKVVYKDSPLIRDYKQAEVGTPDYSDLLLSKYISVIEITNPMHSLWSDGRWNKLTMAHGCYWSKCTFCDGTLDYIGRYEPVKAKLLVDRMEELIKQTDERGFHFVDEAAPPALMKSLALEIIQRKLTVTWWTNVRFEKSFSEDFCRLLKASGCIAVSGGLEVASERLLKLINKGVTLEQVAQVTANFTDAGIMVHSYLMYGFPSQTVQETIDSLEVVRQIFELGIVRSGFWHQFALTTHSPVGQNPDKYGIKPHYNPITFANNDVNFSDKTQVKHEKFSFGLKKSLFNYMHGICFDYPLQDWFEFKVPKTTIPHNFIQKSLENGEYKQPQPTSRVVWLGNMPGVSYFSKKRNRELIKMQSLEFNTTVDSFNVSFTEEKANWLKEVLAKTTVHTPNILLFKDIKKSFHFDDFEVFWYSTKMDKIKELGLLIL